MFNRTWRSLSVTEVYQFRPGLRWPVNPRAKCLFPLVVPGGLILIDDYYTWDGCARAVHDYLSREQAAERIEKTSGGVAYIVRRSDK